MNPKAKEQIELPKEEDDLNKRKFDDINEENMNMDDTDVNGNVRKNKKNNGIIPKEPVTLMVFPVHKSEDGKDICKTGNTEDSAPAPVNCDKKADDVVPGPTATDQNTADIDNVQSGHQVDGPLNNTHSDPSVKKVSFHLVVEDLDLDKTSHECAESGEISQEAIDASLKALDLAVMDSDDTNLVIDEDDSDPILHSQMIHKKPL